MATIIDVREAIVAAIDEKIPSLRTCRAEHADLDDGELTKSFHLAPAVLVVYLGCPGAKQEATQIAAEGRWAAFVLTESAHPDKRNDAAIAIVNTLLLTIPGNRWGQEDARAPERIRAENKFSGRLSGKSVALWVVSWYQGLDLDSTVDPATLDDFLTMHAEFDIDRDGSIDPDDPAAVTEVQLEGT